MFSCCFIFSTNIHALILPFCAAPAQPKSQLPFNNSSTVPWPWFHLLHRVLSRTNRRRRWRAGDGAALPSPSCTSEHAWSPQRKIDQFSQSVNNSSPAKNCKEIHRAFNFRKIRPCASNTYVSLVLLHLGTDYQIGMLASLYKKNTKINHSEGRADSFKFH